MPGVDVSLIDRSVAPCDDFFRFANGKWLERTEIPAEEPAYGGFTEVRDRNLEVMRAVADDAAKSGAVTGSVERKVGDYWASALDEDAIETAGIAPLQPELDLIASLTDRGCPISSPGCSAAAAVGASGSRSGRTPVTARATSCGSSRAASASPTATTT